MWNWFIRNGLAGWFALSLAWGVASIVFDALVLALAGVQYTISWQMQQVARGNPVVPFAISFVSGGLMVHFFKVRDLDWCHPDNPIRYAALGLLMGMVAVAFVWTQRGPNGP